MRSRYEIGLEQYTLSIAVEARLTYEIGMTVVLPAAIRYQTEIATNLAALKAAGVKPDTSALDGVSNPLADLRAGLAALGAGVAEEGTVTAYNEAEHAQKVLLPAMVSVRAAADLLESVVADDLWPLPTYQEMLYVL